MNTELVQTFLPYVVTFLTLIFLGYTLWKDRQPFDLNELPAQLATAKSEAEELAKVAETAVMAAEQLYRTGKIGRNQRWEEAVSYIRRWFPELDSETMAKNIEAAVLLTNQITINLPKKNETE